MPRQVAPRCRSTRRESKRRSRPAIQTAAQTTGTPNAPARNGPRPTRSDHRAIRGNRAPKQSRGDSEPARPPEAAGRILGRTADRARSVGERRAQPAGQPARAQGQGLGLACPAGRRGRLCALPGAPRDVLPDQLVGPRGFLVGRAAGLAAGLGADLGARLGARLADRLGVPRAALAAPAYGPRWVRRTRAGSRSRALAPRPQA